MSHTFDRAIRDFSPELPLSVGFSGGADSSALLLACVQKWPGQVSAIHIHHGLQAAADGFAEHCSRVCFQLGVPILVEKVQAHAAPGQSPEDAARRARYKAFAGLSLTNNKHSAIKTIALAHHADDQIETLLLSLSRGAGLAGLSAMPRRWQRDGITYHRPLLGLSGAEVRGWLGLQGLAFINDPSNSDERFTRNRIRARLLPQLAEVFPQFRETFARSASHAAQAQLLLQEVAEEDLLTTGLPPKISVLRTLSAARQANALRHWLKSTHAVIPSAAQLAELMHQIAACTTRGHRIEIKVGEGFVQRVGPNLRWYNSVALP